MTSTSKGVYHPKNVYFLLFAFGRVVTGASSILFPCSTSIGSTALPPLASKVTVCFVIGVASLYNLALLNSTYLLFPVVFVTLKINL